MGLGNTRVVHVPRVNEKGGLDGATRVLGVELHSRDADHEPGDSLQLIVCKSDEFVRLRKFAKTTETPNPRARVETVKVPDGGNELAF